MRRILGVSTVAAVVLAVAPVASAAWKKPPAKVGTVISQAGIGAVQFGHTTEAQVPGLLGKPDRTHTGTFGGAPYAVLDYRSTYGLLLFLEPLTVAPGKNEMFVFNASVINPAFRAQGTGVHVGSTLAALNRAYPTLSCADNPGPAKVTGQLCTVTVTAGSYQFTVVRGEVTTYDVWG